MNATSQKIDTRIDDHIAKPGPDYWSFRCLECSADVALHVPALVQIVRRVRARLGI